MHGHSYRAYAWFESGVNAVTAQALLSQVLIEFDHSVLPPGLAWAEDLAQHVGRKLACFRVEIDRPLEGICGGWLSE